MTKKIFDLVAKCIEAEEFLKCHEESLQHYAKKFSRIEEAEQDTQHLKFKENFEASQRDCKTRLEELAKHLKESPPGEINQLDPHGYTPLHLACRAGSLQLAEFLLEKKANINFKFEPNYTFPKAPSTALEMAKENEHDVIVALLCDFGAEEDHKEVKGAEDKHIKNRRFSI